MSQVDKSIIGSFKPRCEQLHSAPLFAIFCIKNINQNLPGMLRKSQSNNVNYRCANTFFIS